MLTSKSSTIIIALVIFGCVSNVVYGKLPSQIPICNRNDPDISNCIINSITVLKPRLANGDLGEGLQVPKLEPFYVKSIQIGRTPEFKITLKNLTIYGASGFKVDKLRIKLDDFKVDVLVTFPKLEIFGKYDAVIKLFGQDLNYRDGNGHTIVENSRARIAMKGSKYQKNGAEYLKFEKFRIKVQTGKVKSMKLSDSFLGVNQGVFEETINAFVQTNNDFVSSTIYPPIEKYLGNILTNIANEIVSVATYDELFPK